MIKDILLKAAEDVQQGMLCRSGWFLNEGDGYSDKDLLTGCLTVDDAQSMPRCAEGSIALATAMLGSDWSTYVRTRDHVAAHINHEDGCSVAVHNDFCMKNKDAFEAGQEWATIFRRAADAL